jgi:hypothetical protein
MHAIANFAAWFWGRIVALAKALDEALTGPLPIETDEFARKREDTVFQPRDY